MGPLFVKNVKYVFWNVLWFVVVAALLVGAFALAVAVVPPVFPEAGLSVGARVVIGALGLWTVLCALVSAAWMFAVDGVDLTEHGRTKV